MIDSFSGEFHFLSNFSRSSFCLHGYAYPTVEHYFQALKMTNEVDFQRVRESYTPGDAKRLARSLPKRAFWDQMKVDIMLCGLREKFKQNPSLKKRLLETGDEILVEGNTWNDTFWGVYKGTGLNTLGVLLMQVRAELNEI